MDRKVAIIIAEMMKDDNVILIVDGELVTPIEPKQVNFEIKPYHLPEMDVKAYEPYKPQRDRKQEQYRRKYHSRKK